MKISYENSDYQVSAAELSEAMRDGDDAAFEYFYEERIEQLVTRLRNFTYDIDEAWNIAQDTFVKLWQQRDQIDPEKSLDGLVMTMGTNAAINAQKKKQNHARYHDEQLFLLDNEDLSADADMICSETLRDIKRMIGNMPPQRRMVYELSREEGLTYTEIAERLGLSKNTVRNHIAIALESIRSVLSSIYFIFFHYITR